MWLMEVLDDAPEGSETAQRLRNQLDTPAQLRRLLSGDDVDENVLSIIVQRVGEESIEPLVEALTDSESRAIRRKVFDCLAEMPGQVRDRAIGLLGDERWYVLRNALALLQLVGPLPETCPLGPCLRTRTCGFAAKPSLSSSKAPNIGILQSFRARRQRRANGPNGPHGAPGWGRRDSGPYDREPGHRRG